MNTYTSQFPSLPLDVQDAMTQARKVVDLWFAGADPDDACTDLERRLNDIGVPKHEH